MKALLSISLRLLAIFLSLFSGISTVHAGAFLTNSPMNTARVSHAAVLLSNGKLLVAGGGQSPASAELYDPATGQWTPTGSMLIGHTTFTATLLTNGLVLAAGGYSDNQTNDVELYNPATETWASTGSLLSLRYGHSAVLLFDGRVLVIGGVTIDTNYSITPVNSAELYDPASGTWAATGFLNTPRSGYTLTLLPNGKVLAVGGSGGSVGLTVLNSVETYDPATGLWTTNNPLNFPRSSPSATLLPDGRVLVAGGEDTNFFAMTSAEIFDPIAGTWQLTNSMNTPETSTASLLPNGTVLVNGTVFDDAYTNRAEIYNPSTGIWSSLSAQVAGRAAQTATILANSQVIFTGGYDLESNGTSNSYSGTPLATSVLYDPTINPATGTFLTNAPLGTARGLPTATLLPNSQTLVIGGADASFHPLATTELFDSASRAWTNSASLATARSGNTVTLLPNGRVLVAGGIGTGGIALNSAELYDPVSATWTNTAPLHFARIQPTATLLPNGKVLIAGGDPGTGTNLLSSAEIYDPLTGIWSLTQPMITARVVGTATLLPNGRVLVAGGHSSSNTALANTEIFDPATGRWTPTQPLHTPRQQHTATLLPNGLVLVAGGFNFDTNNNDLVSVELYDPASGAWTLTNSMTLARANHTATLLPNGLVLVAGGGNAQYPLPFAGSLNQFPSAELFDPAAGTWTATDSLNDLDRAHHAAVLLPTGQVLLVGDLYATTGTELYDAGLGYSNTWQPQIISATSPLKLGGPLVVTGAQFRGVSEGASGLAGDWPANYPVVQLRSFANDQSAFIISTNWSTNFIATVPVTNFPPGYAFVTVFVNGIPSVSRVVNISVPVPTAPAITTFNFTNGGFKLVFTNTPGALFGILTTTNPASPLTNWTALGGVVETSPGHFQFSDSQAGTTAQRFYALHAP